MQLLYLAAHDRVAFPVDEVVVRRLIAQDAEFCGHIVLHLMVVAVEVVGRDIEYHGYVGLEVIHIVKLEARQLYDVYGVRVKGHLQGQAFANVACQAYVESGTAQDMVGEQGSGGLAVGAGDAHHPGIGEAAGKFYLGYYRCALRDKLFHQRSGKWYTGTLDHYICV